ncbi:5-oxoprolinase subunit PxpA [Alterisphingorhabdus coralli]|uniref:5-oxoprolinase subunit PxpA n=1 Tax=Alterisphingorhabdus coralli TaxID=3071408 RepID=A0AA97F4S5_9SPHN|nr:5-oxoprolinase subunit PxpA [Parasphingorhabdus sp. SCSIO 66989]WOE74324.1 5-oxoprolinase subunit PxpA [Parasphingorhabdus sp. SCSIO 66989]
MGSIDLNADLGEADDPGDLEADRAMMPVISSCNIACGGHIGNSETMRATLQLARDHGVAAGAHPSYPDRANFGRQTMDITLPELLQSLTSQVCSLIDMGQQFGIGLTHIKPHGALYNDLARDKTLAQPVAASLAENFPGLAIIGLANGAMQAAVEKVGSRYIGEAFVDRRYLDNGHLQPRTEPGSVLTDRAEQAEQAVDIALHNHANSASGKRISIQAQTLCMHGDTEGAAENAAHIRRSLETQSIQIESWAA